MPTATITPPLSDLPRATPPRRAPFVLLGGVPGAGKTTTLHHLGVRAPHVRTLDSERLRERFAAAIPGVPYRWYRWAVHTLSTVHLVLVLLARAVSDGPPLVAAAPATRRLRRTLVARLARTCGWDPVLVMIDVTRETAVRSQHERGRVLDPAAFARHWARWHHQYAALREADAAGTPDGPWTRIDVVGRCAVVPRLLQLTGGETELPLSAAAGVAAAQQDGGDQHEAEPAEAGPDDPGRAPAEAAVTLAGVVGGDGSGGDRVGYSDDDHGGQRQRQDQPAQGAVRTHRRMITHDGEPPDAGQ